MQNAWLFTRSSTRRTAVCGPACTVVWEGRTGDCPPYPDWCAEHVRQLEGGSPFDNPMEEGLLHPQSGSASVREGMWYAVYGCVLWGGGDCGERQALTAIVPRKRAAASEKQVPLRLRRFGMTSLFC
jgi:hypothetical protein